jgi:hypothetical protein
MTVAVKRLLCSPFLVAGVIVFGGVVRIAQDLAGRSLFLDEATVSLNVIDQPSRRLFST